MPETKIEDYAPELGPMGPIGEGAALMLRINRNCPWNQCLFCSAYKGRKFSVRGLEEIQRDIDKVRRIADLLESTSRAMGLNGWIQPEIVRRVIQDHPEIYGDDPAGEDRWLVIRSLTNTANWITYGARRVFLQDANALLMKPGELIEVLHYLKKTFPTVDTVTTYARSKTCAQRSLEELRELHDAGLSWCFVGVESGCDGVLDFMKKGATQREHLSGGAKLMAAGIQMAAFVMPGLAGRDREESAHHVRDTLFVLNEIKPTEIRVRSLAILEDAPLYAKWQAGEFQAPTDDQMVEELKALVEGIRFDCSFESRQMTNVLNLRGRLPERKESFLQSIGQYQALDTLERAQFLFKRYCYGGYLDCVESWGKWDSTLESRIEDCVKSLKNKDADAMDRVEKAIFYIKSKGIP